MASRAAGRATLSTPAARRRARGWRNALAGDRLLPLLGVMVVAATGMLLVFAAKTASMGPTGQALRQGAVRDLNRMRTASDLEPALGKVFEHAGDRRFAAERIFETLPAAGKKGLSHVGALAAIRVDAAPLARRGDLGRLRERAAAQVAARARAERAAPRGGGARREPPGMTLLTADQLRDLKPALVVRAPGRFQSGFLLNALALLVAALLAHALVHGRGRSGDSLLLPIATLLAGVGFIVLTSLRDPLRDMMLFQPFTGGVVGGGAAFVLASLHRYEGSFLRRLALVPLLGALLLSAALVVAGAGPSGSDAKVNLFGIQPVEVIRLLLVLFLAGWFAERWPFLRNLDEPREAMAPWLQRLRLPRRRHAAPVVLGVAVAIVFFFLQRDLGPALILLGLFLSLYALSRGGWALALVGLGAIVAAFGAGYLIGFPDTVTLRTAMALSPWENGLARGDQLAHGLWAFAAGGFSGMGPGLGIPGFVPAAHTDFILAAVGEELGFLGFAACFVLEGLLVARGLAIARRAPDAYTMFLALGLTLSLALQILLIAAGVLGLVPLSGVVTPFLSHGRSALIVHFACLGILWSIAASSAERAEAPARVARRDLGAAWKAQALRSEADANTEERPFAAAVERPLRVLIIVLLICAGLVLARAAQVQIAAADATLGRGTLALQADGELRYQYNPRLLRVAAAVPRGDILDRDGLPLATSRWSRLEARRERYDMLGIDIDRACGKEDARHYPLGGAAVHLLGDWVSRTHWGASNTDYLERSEDDHLSGFDDHAHVVSIRDPKTRQQRRVVRRDLSELVPLWRHRHQPRHKDVAAFLKRPRDVRTTIDARLQLAAAHLLRDDVRAVGLAKGAIVVLDAEHGDLLACVSWPLPEAPVRGQDARLPAVGPTDTAAAAGPLFDRARFGLYPPGSTFKLVTAAAALEKDPALGRVRFFCRPLEGGRVGARVGGRIVRDDPTDHAHGEVDLQGATVASCNAFYAQLGTRVGWSGLAAMAGRFDIDPGNPAPAERPAHLIEASYGQAQVLASPLRMARVAAVIANGGLAAAPHGVLAPVDSVRGERVMSAATARTLAGYMRGVVARGTAQRLREVSPPIAGKTGTAQVANAASHSWFIGYAPGGPARRHLAFAVLVENGGYGGVRAAQVAGDLIRSAHAMGITP